MLSFIKLPEKEMKRREKWMPKFMTQRPEIIDSRATVDSTVVMAVK
jgi:hypothetical protein